MAIREGSHRRSSPAAGTPMAAATTTVQVIATWPRCRELQWHLCSHHQTLGQGRAWPTVPRVATRSSATSSAGSKIWLAVPCCTKVRPLGHQLCCAAIDCACASPVKGTGAAPMLPTPRPLGKGKDRFSLPVENRAVQRQCHLRPSALPLPSRALAASTARAGGAMH